ncbi:RING-box protein 2 isoform X3 [Gallus gallus]|uniref:RING-box protein 2 isoform X3 n=1 Tax=Gallus gallus TaxID=9031 RepID=UPI001F02C1C5|nr:RING-box protein 2 isoform X3 [Gallus gallus]XP_046779737.1 RING-box protein 2 isoform X3 [Gallus gallus]
MADVEDGDELGAPHSHPGSSASKAGGPDKMFSLKKWNAVAMWSWDVECDTCAICRVQVMGKRLPAGPGPPWPPSPPLGGGCPPGQPALPRGCPPSGDAASGPVWPCPSFTLPRPPGSEGRSRFLRRPSLRRPREGSGRDACLRCQAENKQEDCVVVWGECNHSFHNCCMSLWVKQNNRCPLCQQDWVVQRIGK